MKAELRRLIDWYRAERRGVVYVYPRLKLVSINGHQRISFDQAAIYIRQIKELVDSGAV
jgi:hypothetical protein